MLKINNKKIKMIKIINYNKNILKKMKIKILWNLK